MLSEKEIKTRLINNDDLFYKIVVLQQDFEIIPHNGNHIGAYIKIRDQEELRKQFLDSLNDTIVDYVYSSQKYTELIEKEMKKNKKSPSNANSYVKRKASHKFRGNYENDNLIIQGQLGELLLFHFIQRFKGAVPLLRKMSITTSQSMERYGVDAIHYKYEDGKTYSIWGKQRLILLNTRLMRLLKLHWIVFLRQAKILIMN